MQALLNALAGVKDGPIYLLLGLIGGFGGSVIRAIEKVKQRRSGSAGGFRPVSFILSLVEIAVWTIIGGCFALALDTHPLISLVSGLAAPALYAMTQRPEVIKALLLAVSKGATGGLGWVVKALVAQAAMNSDTTTANPTLITNTKAQKKETHSDDDADQPAPKRSKRGS